MAHLIGKVAIIGQGLIGSSITRAVFERALARETVITDASPAVRKRLLELGLGEAKVVDTASEAVSGADLVICCVPVRAMQLVVRDIAPHLKAGAILSDVGSVKAGVVSQCAPLLGETVSFVPAHPLAGTEFSGPDAGMPRLFVNRWCILTPPEGTDEAAVATVKRFWEGLGSKIEIMSPQRHDNVLAITSHLPHLVAFSIFHTGLAEEERSKAPVMQFSAGAFKDFTRIASSNPEMWRDIFLMNREAVLASLNAFTKDMEAFARAIAEDDGDRIEKFVSLSRSTRKRVIEKALAEEKAQQAELKDTLFRPYSDE